MDQISSIEHFLEAGDAAVSNEVAQQARHVIWTKLSLPPVKICTSGAPRAPYSAGMRCDTALGACR